MEVIVKSSPKIEIELATKVVKVGGKVTVDPALSTESENPVQNKVITEELEKKATNEALDALSGSVASLEGEVVRKGDYSPENKVGTADDLAGRGESVPAEFGFRASGGKSIKDGRAYIKRIKGNSVVWNQLVPSFDANKWYISPTLAAKEFINNGVRLTFNIDQDSAPANGVAIVMTGTSSSFANHAYLTMVEFKPSRTISVSARNFHSPWGGAYHTTAEEGKWTTLAYIYTPTTDYEGYLILGTEHGTDVIKGETLEIRNARVIDLTKMFGAGYEPTTIEEFNAKVATLGIEDMNAYNEGQVIHCNTESIKSVGDNAWDGVLETSWKTSKIRCLSNEQYCLCGLYYNQGSHSVFFYDSEDNEISRIRYAINFFLYNKERSIFTTPANCAYFVFEFNSNFPFSDYKDQIVISLYHSGWKAEVDNTYKPYWQDTLPLPIIRKYFPQGMKKAGSAHDEIRYNKASGKWEAVQRFGEVDLGTLDWVASDHNRLYSTGLKTTLKPTDDKINAISSRLTAATSSDVYNNTQDKIMGTNLNAVLTVYDSAYVDNPSGFKTAMQGVILYYELAEPIVTELDAEDQNFRDYYNVADFGTEMSQSSVPSAPFSADIIYQFNAVDMIREHELEITELQSIIAAMQAQLTSLINGGQ